MGWEQFNKSGSRMYSLNLAAVVMTMTSLIPDVLVDEASHTAYFVFPECAAVEAVIKEYKAGTLMINVKAFLNSIKTLRTTMGTMLR